MLFYYTPSHGTADIAQALAAACPDGETTPSLSVVNTILKDLPEGQVIFILSEPLSQIIQALAKPTTPQETLAHWQSQAGPVLAAKRLHRRQITIIWAHEAVAYPQELGNQCGVENLTLDPALTPKPLDPLMQMIAHHTLNTSPDAMALYEELMASAPNLSNGTANSYFGPDAVLNAYKASQVVAQKKADQVTLLQGILTQTNQELSKNAQDFDAVQAKLSQAQVDHEQYKTSFRQIQTELAQSNSRLEASEKDYTESQFKLTQLTASHTALITEKASLQKVIDSLHTSQNMQKEHNVAMAQEIIDLEMQKEQLGQRLDQVNQGMDSYHAQVGNLRQSLEAGKSQNRDLSKTVMDLEHSLRTEEHEIRRIMNSRSIRMTSPIRKLGNLLRRLRGSRS